MPSKYSAKQKLSLIKRHLDGESVALIAESENISKVIFYRWLSKYKKLGKEGLDAGVPGRPKKRKKKPLRTSSQAKTISPHERLRMVEEVIEEGASPTYIAKKYNVSRVTLYKWIRRYKDSNEQRMAAVQDKPRQYDRYHRQSPELYEDAVLSIVSKYPEFGVRKIVQTLPHVGGKPILGHHGVQNILARNSLSTMQDRFVYAEGQKTVVTDIIGRFVSAASTFFTRTPATRTRVIKAVTAFSLSAFVTVVAFGAGSLTVGTFAGETLSTQIGLVFAYTALIMGSMFFLYSMKYYLTLAIVLSYSQNENKNKKNGLISRIIGNSSIDDVDGDSRLTGLAPDLSHVKLKRYPFVSVQIPFFNEKNVAERAITASTNFDYKGDYEVIVCDDSTDETVDIVRAYQRRFLEKGERLKITKGKGWDMATVEVRPGVTLKHLHRTSRSGYKGAALNLALKLVDTRTEFISIFDADFVPYPDSLTLFLKYYQASAGTIDFGKGIKSSEIAAVQGYQWHVLNKSENWITRGIRSEYSGSYVIERSGQEIYGGMKHISGSVYMIRRDVLNEIGWDSSITEDYELTLKLHHKGYKVLYTPYIQAPAECVSTLKRLIRQRMRWAEGHSYNVKKMAVKLLWGSWEDLDKKIPRQVGSSHLAKFVRDDKIAIGSLAILSNKHRQGQVFVPSPLTGAEKMEFVFNIPYYLQAFFFLIGTIAWLLSEAVFPARLPFWTTLWGWSLVLTNMFSLPLMNSVGLFLEESEDRDYLGVASFFALSYILVPFQAYAAVKGFLEKEEGGWFRTPKTGRITDVFNRGRFYRFIQGILPGTSAKSEMSVNVDSKSSITKIASSYFSLTTANSQFNSFGIKPKKRRWIGKVGISFVLSLSILLVTFAPFVQDGSSGGKLPELSVERPHFSLTESPEFVLDTKNSLTQRQRLSLVSRVQAQENEMLKTEIYYGNEKVDIPVDVLLREDGDLSLKLASIETARPGKYTLKTTLKDGDNSVTVSQDFTWGVLVINSDKSIYMPGDVVHLSFAVLDDRGSMDCTASLRLSITNSQSSIYEELSTEEGSIQVNDACLEKEYKGIPDYEAWYEVDDLGEYDLELVARTANGIRTIDGSFAVQEVVSFDIQRDSATRIYPVDPYEMKILVTPQNDFDGKVVESVPSSFEILNNDTNTLNNFIIQDSKEQNTKELVWDVNWKAGEKYELSYIYDAPDVSPEFYTTGPLRLVTHEYGVIFEEARAWQIASDAIGDIGIWRDSVGSQIPGISFAAFNFATEERNDGAYTFTGSNNLNLDEAGNYLLIGTLSMDDNSNGRVNYEGRFSYTGSGDFISMNGSGYSRNNANDHSWVRVVGLVWGGAANDDVQFEVRRDTDTPTAGSLINESHFQVIRLPDSVAAGIYTDTSDTTSYESQAWTDAPLNNNVLQNDTSVIEKQAGNTDIRLKKDATTFLIGYGLVFDMGDGNRTQRITKMVAGASDIQNSFSYTYMRSTADQYGAPNGMFLYRNSGTSTDLSIQAQRGNAELVGATGTTRRTSTSGMFVVELPSYVETFISYDSTGAQDIGGTNGDYNAMRDVNYNDATSFTKVDNATVNAEKAMDVLLMGQASAERSGTSGTRMTAGCRFEIQGADQTLGGHGWYLRGNESGGARNYTYNYGCSPSGMYSVSANDDIQFEWWDDGDNGSTDNTIASAVGFSALNIDTLTPPDLTQQHFRWRNDDGSETTATWAANEDTTLTDVVKETLYRLRFGLSNEGGGTTGAIAYQLQVAETATCLSGTYTAVPTDTSGDWQVVDSSNLTDGVATTNVAGGLTDEATTFVAGEVKDIGNTTGSITLAGDEFTEIEFAVQATNNATDLGNYCFRLYDSTNGVALDTYTNYAEAVVVPEYIWLFFGLGPILPGLLARAKKRREQSK